MGGNVTVVESTAVCASFSARRRPVSSIPAVHIRRAAGMHTKTYPKKNWNSGIGTGKMEPAGKNDWKERN